MAADDNPKDFPAAHEIAAAMAQFPPPAALTATEAMAWRELERSLYRRTTTWQVRPPLQNRSIIHPDELYRNDMTNNYFEAIQKTVQPPDSNYAALEDLRRQLAIVNADAEDWERRYKETNSYLADAQKTIRELTRKCTEAEARIKEVEAQITTRAVTKRTRLITIRVTRKD